MPNSEWGCQRLFPFHLGQRLLIFVCLVPFSVGGCEIALLCVIQNNLNQAFMLLTLADDLYLTRS